MPEAARPDSSPTIIALQRLVDDTQSFVYDLQSTGTGKYFTKRSDDEQVNIQPTHTPKGSEKYPAF
jgi:hypothetical protein